jgi:hypothetical protein
LQVYGFGDCRRWFRHRVVHASGAFSATTDQHKRFKLAQYRSLTIAGGFLFHAPVSWLLKAQIMWLYIAVFFVAGVVLFHGFKYGWFT